MEGKRTEKKRKKEKVRKNKKEKYMCHLTKCVNIRIIIKEIIRILS